MFLIFGMYLKTVGLGKQVLECLWTSVAVSVKLL